MKNKKVFKLLLSLLAVIAIIAIVNYNSELSKNNRYLREKLLKGVSNTSGTGEDLFNFDYDQVYVFKPYQSKDEMEKEIGFKFRGLQETVSEAMMNILFVKDNSPIAYLYGYGSNNGFYLSLPEGNYSKSELEQTSYKVERNELGNSSGKEETYLNYVFYFKR